MAESFFATLECELLDRRVFKSKAEARSALFTYELGNTGYALRSLRLVMRGRARAGLCVDQPRFPK